MAYQFNIKSQIALISESELRKRIVSVSVYLLVLCILYYKKQQSKSFEHLVYSVNVFFILWWWIKSWPFKPVFQSPYVFSWLSPQHIIKQQEHRNTAPARIRRDHEIKGRLLKFSLESIRSRCFSSDLCNSVRKRRITESLLNRILLMTNQRVIYFKSNWRKDIIYTKITTNVPELKLYLKLIILWFKQYD